MLLLVAWRISRDLYHVWVRSVMTFSMYVIYIAPQCQAVVLEAFSTINTESNDPTSRLYPKLLFKPIAQR